MVVARSSDWSVQLRNLPSLSLQCLKTTDVQDDIHASFGELLGELHKQDAPYALSVANRLYGEQSYQFIEVCVCVQESFIAHLFTFSFLLDSFFGIMHIYPMLD